MVEEEYTGKRIGSTTGGTGGKRRERKAFTYVEEKVQRNSFARDKKGRG